MRSNFAPGGHDRVDPYVASLLHPTGTPVELSIEAVDQTLENTFPERLRFLRKLNSEALPSMEVAEVGLPKRRRTLLDVQCLDAVRVGHNGF
jgi:hypothetical protein